MVNTIEDEQETFNDPFNPESISIESKIIPMETILRRLIQGTIIMNPDFQRMEVWDESKKSQLIESLMLKIPIPMFYVSANEKAIYTVVDGLQRLSTIRSFVLGDNYLENRNEDRKGEGFVLQNLEFWKEYNGKSFNQLPINLQNRILETEFTFTIISFSTPEEVKRNIFKRINTGGEPLSSQEIRNALYIGKSTVLLNKLAHLQEFKQATNNTISSKRMEDKELILRFLAFLVRDYTTFKKTVSVDTFLSDTMVIINAYPEFSHRSFQKLVSAGNIKISDIATHVFLNIEVFFKTAMLRSFNLFGEHTFRRSFGKDRKTPINKSLFEMWAILLGKLSDQEYENIVKNQQHLFDNYKDLLNNLEFQTDISRDSLKIGAVQRRFIKINNLINELKND